MRYPQLGQPSENPTLWTGRDRHYWDLSVLSHCPWNSQSIDTLGLVKSKSSKPAIQSYTFSTWGRETVRRSKSPLAHSCQLFPRKQCLGQEALASNETLLWILPSGQPLIQLKFMLAACCTFTCTSYAGLLSITPWRCVCWQSTQKWGLPSWSYPSLSRQFSADSDLFHCWCALTCSCSYTIAASSVHKILLCVPRGLGAD